MKPEEQMQAQSTQTGGPIKESVREQDRIMLVLSYLGLLALVPLLTVSDSEYVKWHAKHGLVLGVGGVIVLTVVGAIPIIWPINCLAAPALIVVNVMAMVKALNGERWRIPYVTDLSEKF
jgi:uncharacterized membrane protein